MTGFGAGEGTAGGRAAPDRDPDGQPPVLQSLGQAPVRSCPARVGAARAAAPGSRARAHQRLGALGRVAGAGGRAGAEPRAGACRRRPAARVADAVSAWWARSRSTWWRGSPRCWCSTGASSRPSSWAELEPIVGGGHRRVHGPCGAAKARRSAAELSHRLDLLEGAARRIAELAPARLPRERDRLRSAVSELLDGRAVGRRPARAGDRRPGRQAGHHRGAGALRARIWRPAAPRWRATPPVGKQLGFLSQELGREINTMGSKANDAEIAQQVIAMKGELEKFREQLENLE